MSQAIANKSTANQSAVAWLLECGEAQVLISATNMLHVIEDTRLRYHVPMTPAYCNSVLVWQRQLMPVVNLSKWLNASTKYSCPYSCVLGWQDVDHGTEYGALAASAFPQRVMIHDSQCVTPSAELLTVWGDHALCFVDHNKMIVPIIDPARFFGAAQFERDTGSDSIGMIA
jgi:chemotaxis signal transduction protein